MAQYVLDASALIALLHAEPGSEKAHIFIDGLTKKALQWQLRHVFLTMNFYRGI